MCRVIGALAAALAVAGCASLSGPATPAHADGGVLVDPQGMVLYTFDRDVAGTVSGKAQSACNAECAQRWPPFAAGLGARPTGDFTLIERDDATRQWVYKGRPLYRWREDANPGDKTGDGVDNLWRAARP